MVLWIRIYLKNGNKLKNKIQKLNNLNLKYPIIRKRNKNLKFARLLKMLKMFIKIQNNSKMK